MVGLKTLYARHLSRKGEHTAALAMCDVMDIYVLSRAGMHLSVLALSQGDNPEVAAALIQIGEAEKALSMLKLFPYSRRIRPAIGQLACIMPEQVLPLTVKCSELVEVRTYCEMRVGVTKKIAFSEAPAQEATLHIVAFAMNIGNRDAAKTNWEQTFSQSGLQAPIVNWACGKIDLRFLKFAEERKPEIFGPMISIILTTHNEQKYIATAISSILNQTWKNLEIIVVDDGSTDSTEDVAKDLSRQDYRIKIISLGRNVGTWRAKNIGLIHASGEFITMHDADDWSHPAKLELQVAPLLERKNVMCSSSYFFRVQEETGTLFTRNACSYLRWNPSSLLFRRTVLDELGNYFPDLLGGDCEFAARIETRWGMASHAMIKKPLSVGWQRKRSLSNMFRSREEIEYRISQWERWRRLHVGFYEKII